MMRFIQTAFRSVLALLLLMEAVMASANTWTGTYPSYFQDPAFTSTGMWNDQVVVNQPPRGWTDPVFQLSDGFHAAPVERDYPWLKFNPFRPGLSQIVVNPRPMRAGI